MAALSFLEIVGPHQMPPHPLGVHLSAVDEHSAHGVPHRVLNDGTLHLREFTSAMRGWLITHHVSPEQKERDRKRTEALARQGFASLNETVSNK